jgi:hypothetical protein
VACLESRVEPPAGPHNFYDLLRVGYTHAVPEGTEFPWVFPQLNLFARFFHGRGTVEFEAKVVWLDAPDGRRTIDFFGPMRVAFRPAEPVRDVVFRFQNLPVEGTGRYRIELRAIRPKRPRPLATEFLTVVRQS